MAPWQDRLERESPVVFTVTAGTVALHRLAQSAWGLYGLLMLALVYPWSDPPPPPPPSIAVYVWSMLGGSLAVILGFVWVRWTRIPKGASGGRLRLGPEGLSYRIGNDQLELPWSQIAAVHAIRRPPKPRVRALWLPRDDGAPLGRTRASLLERAHLKAPYRLLQREDGVLLPLVLFGPSIEVADTIFDTVCRFHAAAQAAGPATAGAEAAAPQ